MAEKLAKHVRELSLFSGYCGITLGLRLAGIPIHTIGYVEIDEYCQRLIQARIRDGYLDWAPIIRDIRSADFRPMAGLVDIVTAGFPCQPFSILGQHRGIQDERNLWPETLRVIGEVRPGYVLLENVANLLSTPYWGTILAQLSIIGYDARWEVVSACQVGAPHTRERVLCLAYPNGKGWTDSQRVATAEACPILWNASCLGSSPDIAPARTVWPTLESEMVGGFDGHPDTVAQLRAAGNGIVPSVVAKFLRG